ncbi:Precorrin-6Y C(5,15)-methyltransferase [decarboxylating] [Candidatus Johnevansia muelleri]|uniref:tRNA (guanine(46)-N(7))-methyltransferase n=1 Tax=Candidatus Johnevansia muelleri TaxID=1495769 RepID=A0A078KDR0_9GAMM|nr:Precorrin-6Y C(5,15)-methyltransferase [decarboxylating] [Candidatus Evansia muelleri]
MLPWLSIIGIGEDGLKGLIKAAIIAIAQSKILFGGQRHINLFKIYGKETYNWSYPIEQGIKHLCYFRGNKVAILASGDPFFFGIGTILTQRIPIKEIRCYPSISVFSLVCARIGWTMQDVEVISLHGGRTQECIYPYLHDGARIILLTYNETSPAIISALLVDRGFGKSKFIILEGLNGPYERVRAMTAHSFINYNNNDINPLNVIAIDVIANIEIITLPLTFGRCDNWFDNNGQITKSDIRALTIAKLAPRRMELLWDIGAGSGSISIEWMLIHPSLEAIAIEVNEKRAINIMQNAYRLGVNNLCIVNGDSMDIIYDLAFIKKPDAIFIGGGAGVANTKIISFCMNILRHKGRLVINAVTLKSELALIRYYYIFGGTLIRVAIEQVSSLGNNWGWKSKRTVTQWCWSNIFN